MRRKSKSLSKFFRNTLIFLGILLTFGVLIIQLIYSAGNSETLSCIKLEPEHISCQLEKSHLYGSESTPTETFKLTKADILVIGKGDDIKHEKLVLYDNDNRPIDFYEDRQTVLFNNVQSDKEKINQFIIEAEEKQTLKISSYGFIRIAKTSIDIIAMLLSILLIISLIFYLNYKFDLNSK
ncbi:MAG: hypothetical protein AAFQ91_01165 [Cyanobacteria bacterium J06621_15]